MTRSKTKFIAALMVGLVVGGFAGAVLPNIISQRRIPSTNINQDQALGYSLLISTLRDESQLHKLIFLKKVTFDKPREAYPKAHAHDQSGRTKLSGRL